MQRFFPKFPEVQRNYLIYYQVTLMKNRYMPIRKNLLFFKLKATVLLKLSMIVLILKSNVQFLYLSYLGVVNFCNPIIIYVLHRQFNVVWGKQTKKKHKTWEGDGILEVENDIAVLKVSTSTEIGNIVMVIEQFNLLMLFLLFTFHWY